MRETKFKAWDIKSKKWIIILKIVFGFEDNQGFIPLHIIEPETGKYYGLLTNEPDAILVEYTGLKDKNGKEIYEGDIICRHWDDGTFQNGQIIYEDGCFRWQEINKDRFLHPIGINTLHSEVIGNIYENKEINNE